MAKYRCLKCEWRWESEPKVTKCPACEHLYVEWLDYDEEPLELVKYPDLRLKQKCELVTEFGLSLEQFCRKMSDFMDQSKGVGLAANQVGDNRRIVIVKVESEGCNVPMINPSTIVTSGTSAGLREGCLSFPGGLEVLQRDEQVTVSYHTPYGELHTLTLKGIESVCVQHEIDHLDGVTMVDHMSRLKRQMFLKKVLKRNLL